jgi:hypothetical protein
VGTRLRLFWYLKLRLSSIISHRRTLAHSRHDCVSTAKEDRQTGSLQVAGLRGLDWTESNRRTFKTAEGATYSIRSATQQNERRADVTGNGLENRSDRKQISPLGKVPERPSFLTAFTGTNQPDGLLHWPLHLFYTLAASSHSSWRSLDSRTASQLLALIFTAVVREGGLWRW